MSFEDALNFVQNKRSRVAPNFGFLGQLLALYKMVQNGSWINFIEEKNVTTS